VIDLIEPYLYVRAITLGLGTLWSIQWAFRLVRFANRWRGRLLMLGASERWLRNLLLVTVLRTTILDPINLALMFLLTGLWTLRSFL